VTPTNAPTVATAVPTATQTYERYYEIFSDKLRNSWTANAENVAQGGVNWDSNRYMYNSEDSIELSLRAGGSLRFSRRQAIENQYDYVEFAARSDSNMRLSVSLSGFNAYSSAVAVTNTWNVYRIQLSTLGAPSQLGNPTSLLLVNSAGTVTPKLYVAEIRLVQISNRRPRDDDDLVVTSADDEIGVVSAHPPSVVE